MMKRVVVFTIAAVAAMVSCTAEREVLEPENELITITASQEGEPGTKTVLDEDLIHVLWSPEDEINLFYQDKNERFVSINSYENAAVAQFRGQMTIDVVTGGNEGSEMESSYFWGLYPYWDAAKYDMDKGIIETYLPWEQTAAVNSFADDLFISMGRSTSWNMPFYNVCSGLRFTVDQEVASVTLRSNDGTPLAGRFQAGFDPETERPVVVEVIERYPEVRLYPPKGDSYFYPGVYYYIVTLPGTHQEGITIDLEGLPNTASVTTKSPVTFQRSRFLPTDLTADRYYADILPLESIDLDIENEGVRDYLEKVDYSSDLDNYSESYIKDFLSLGSDKPEPVRFHWKDSAPRTLVVYDEVTGETVYEGDASGSVTEIYNLIPGRKYSYSVEGDIPWKSSFSPKGPVRMIQSKTSNFRDLGGWTGEDGKSIVYGKLYRGAQISGDDELLFQSLGIGVDLDLRGKPGSPGSVFNQDYVLYKNIQVYQFMYSGGGSSGGGGGPSSGSSTEGYTAPLYREALSFVIDCLNQGKRVYFHCIGGADRTGTLAFLIEALLGVDEADMSKDYELTSFSTERLRNDDGTRPFKRLVFYLKTFPGSTLQEMVTNWATTGENALTLEEIQLLKELMLE